MEFQFFIVFLVMAHFGFLYDIRQIRQIHSKTTEELIIELASLHINGVKWISLLFYLPALPLSIGEQAGAHYNEA